MLPLSGHYGQEAGDIITAPGQGRLCTAGACKYFHWRSFLQTFHHSDRYDNSYIVSRDRELVNTFRNIKYLCNIASDRAANVRMMEGRRWIFGGGPDQVLLLLV